MVACDFINQPRRRWLPSGSMTKLPLLLALLPFATAVLAAPDLSAPSAQVFDAVKKLDSIDAQWRTRLCALLPQPCDAQQLGLYRPRGAAAAALDEPQWRHLSRPSRRRPQARGIGGHGGKRR